MVVLSQEAQSQLARYLRRMRSALRGHPSVDPDDIERDVLGHIDAELAGHPEPVVERDLRIVLDRLGAPNQWVPAEELTPWWGLISSLRNGPEDWRLAYLSMMLAFVGVALFLGGPWLWPLPALLPIVAFFMARASIELLDHHDEPIGARRWLLFPVLVPWYAVLAVALLLWPMILVAGVLNDTGLEERMARAIPEWAWAIGPASMGLGLGLWWTCLGLMLRRSPDRLRATFRPFASGFDRRHGTRLAVVGFLLAAAAGALVAIMLMSPAPAAAAEATPAVPRDPAVAIKGAFETYQLVALGDNHGNVQVHDLRLALIRDPRLAGAFHDIIVEFGNARYQELMDRFINGETVAADDLRHVWQDTTQVEEAWDLPIYEELFRAVRDVNASRPPEQRLRVLLGDPPIDWSTVQRADDLKPWLDRDGHAVNVIRREVLARKRRGLIVYGDQHLVRKNTRLDATDEWANGIVASLERDGTARVFNIHTDTRLDMTAIQADIATWPKPSLTMLRGTTLGQTVMEPGPGRKPVRMEEQFDAIVYLGAPGSMTSAWLSPAQCKDERYLAMRSSRLTLMPPPSDAPFNFADRLKAKCAFPKSDAAIADRDPAFTGLVRATLLDAQQGQSNPDRFSPDLRPRLVLFSQRYGPRILGSLGELKALTLIGDATVAGQHLRRYRAEFAKGRMIWTIGVSPEGTIGSMDPSREP